MKLVGISDKPVHCKRKVVTTIRLQDQKERTLEAYVVEEHPPADLLLGMDFIKRHRLSFIPTREGFEIWDESQDPRRIAYDSEKAPPTSPPERDKVNAFRSQVLNARVAKVEAWGNKMDKEDLEFLEELSHYRLVQDL